jgi:hypothetical protein
VNPLLRTLAVLVVLGAVAATASAQVPAPAMPPMSAGADCGPGYAGSGFVGSSGRAVRAGSAGDPRFGLNPGLRWLLSCGRYKPPKVVAAPPALPTGGTLAFPNHPFARSPRDFFMVDVP